MDFFFVLVSNVIYTVYEADQIVVLDDGRLVEIGAHEALILRDGPYARLANAYGDVPA